MPCGTAAAVLASLLIVIAGYLGVAAKAPGAGLGIDPGRLVDASLSLWPFALAFGVAVASRWPRIAVPFLAAFAGLEYFLGDLAPLFRLPDWMANLSVCAGAFARARCRRRLRAATTHVACSTMRDRFRDGGAWQDAAGYSRAARRGPLIAVSGTTAEGPNGGALHPGDTYAQTRDALLRAVAAVEALGGTVQDVVRTRVYLAPGAAWEDAARAHQEVLGAVAPANTLLHVASLIGEDTLVEVEVLALCE